MIEVNQDVLNDINSNFVIPPKPQILTDLQTLAESKDPALADLAELVAKDVAISSSILKLINSPAYGLSRTVSDIKQAVMFLGWDGVTALVQGLKLKQAFSREQSCISLERFWDTATDIADVIMFIGHQFKSQVPVESLYSLGLFHDCGVPPMAVKYSNYVDILKRADKVVDLSITDIEGQAYQTNHAVVGYFLATSWHLPKDICQLILRHHDLSMLENLNGSIEQMSFSALKLAENLVNQVRRGSSTRDWLLIEPVALDALGMYEDDYRDLQEDVSDLLNR